MRAGREEVCGEPGVGKTDVEKRKTKLSVAALVSGRGHRAVRNPGKYCVNTLMLEEWVGERVFIQPTE